ncbi:MAG: right-handed parallel beta-helix repeat-containing protein [Deltaproteobacteria bacterium]|nr:right-handed parallel beta-helix repeat-containing protein [Deltaproteobacteria bacterium]
MRAPLACVVMLIVAGCSFKPVAVGSGSGSGSIGTVGANGSSASSGTSGSAGSSNGNSTGSSGTGSSGSSSSSGSSGSSGTRRSVTGVSIVGESGPLELRVGGSATLIITGSGLDEATLVKLGNLTGVVIAQSSTTLQVDVTHQLPQDPGLPATVSVWFGSSVLTGGPTVTMTEVAISPSGDDTAQGSTSYPFQTLSHALGVTEGYIRVNPGTYYSSLETFPRDEDGGDPANIACNFTGQQLEVDPDAGPIVFEDDADAGQVPFVICSVVNLWGLTVDGFAYGMIFKDRGTDNLADLVITHARHDGFVDLGSGHITVANSTFSSCAGSGVHLRKSAADDYFGPSIDIEQNGVGFLDEDSTITLLGAAVSNNVGAGIVAVCSHSSCSVSLQGTSIVEANGASGIQLLGASSIASPHALGAGSTVEIRNNVGDGIDVFGAFSSLSTTPKVSGNANGVVVSDDAGAPQLSFAQIFGNRGAGILLTGPLNGTVKGYSSGNGTNLVADSSFIGQVDVSGLRMDAPNDAGQFADANPQGFELAPWSDGTTEYIDDAGRTTQPFDWVADAGQGPFNYKLLSDAGTLVF